MKGNKINIYNNGYVLFIILFPFIYPLGLDLIGITKYMIIGWELIAIFFLVVFCRKRIKFSKYMWSVVLYQAMMLAITFVEVGGIGDGLKKLFVFPFACIITDLWCKKNPKLLIKGVIYILFIEELFTLILWNVSAFGEGRYFVGIRTDFPVIGFLAMFVAILSLYLQIESTTIPSIVTIILVLISIFKADVSTGIVGMGLLLILLIFIRFRILERFIQVCDNKKLIPIGIAMNIAFVFFGVQSYFSTIISQLLGESMKLNGRTLIWEVALMYIAKKPYFGYGVYGVYVPVAWGSSYNYLHTETLQLLLDGGIALAICFLLIVLYVAKGIDSCEDYFMRKLATICLFCCFIMMITEVFTFYMWFWVLITIMANMKEFEKLVPEDGFARSRNE